MKRQKRQWVHSMKILQKKTTNVLGHKRGIGKESVVNTREVRLGRKKTDVITAELPEDCREAWDKLPEWKQQRFLAKAGIDISELEKTDMELLPSQNNSFSMLEAGENDNDSDYSGSLDEDEKPYTSAYGEEHLHASKTSQSGTTMSTSSYVQAKGRLKQQEGTNTEDKSNNHKQQIIGEKGLNAGRKANRKQIARGLSKKSKTKLVTLIRRMNTGTASELARTAAANDKDVTEQVNSLASFGVQRIGLKIGKVVGLALKKVLAAIASAIASAIGPVLAIVILIVVILVVIIAAVGGGSGGGEAIVKVALAEVKEENNGGEKFWSFLGFPSRVAWCAGFVSWCADDLGYIESGIVPKSGWCNDYRAFYKEKGLWQDGPALSGAYIPKAGDFILFEWGNNLNSSLDHIGIVEKSEGGIVYTVEGNSSDAVKRRTYSINDSRIVGYCTPEYPTSGAWDGELVGDTNAEKLFNACVSAGYSKVAAAAMVGNFAGEGGIDANGDVIINSTEGNGEGVGFVQWSFGRKDAFLAFAASKGEPWPNTSLAVQLQYLFYELDNGQWIWTSIGQEYGSQYNISLEAFKQSTDIEVATIAFCAKFERPHKRNAHLDRRISYAKKVLESYG